MCCILGEMKYCRTDQDINSSFMKGHIFYQCGLKTVDIIILLDGLCLYPRHLNGDRITVHAKDLITLSQEINLIPPFATTGIQYLLILAEPAFQDLVQQVNVQISQKII